MILPVLLLLVFLLVPVPQDRLHRNLPLRVFSVEGELLWDFRDNRGTRIRPLALREFPVTLQRAALTSEDGRFRYHPGFDPAAILRSFFRNLISLRIRSGASTITQQLARTVYAGELPSSRWLRKISEILLALRLEVHYSKNEILTAYLNQVPMPGNHSGLAAASETLFGKNPRLLTREEEVALVILIRQPPLRTSASRLKFLKQCRHLWQRLYARDFDAEKFSSLTHRFGASRPQGRQPEGEVQFADWLRREADFRSGDIRSTIVASWNRQTQKIVQAEMETLRTHGADNAAVIVLALGPEEHELKVMVGSRDFLSPESGQVNHALAIRSAGSTLKPLLYGLGMDLGLMNGNTIVHDRRRFFATGHDGEMFKPSNNDMAFWGDITLREALAASRNVPAVEAVEKIGVDRFLEFLRSAGFTHLQSSPDYYGPGIALGSGGASLIMLARAYSLFPSGGELRPLLLGKRSDGGKIFLASAGRLLKENSAAKITDILADRKSRARAFGERSFLDFPFPVAAKTGTSKDYHDAWTVGYTGSHLVAVWVGNSRNKALEEISGGWGAGRIFQQVMRMVTPPARREKFKQPAGLSRLRICRLSGQRAGGHCSAVEELFGAEDEIPGFCRQNHDSGSESGGSRSTGVPEIISPVQGEHYVIDPGRRRGNLVPIIIEYSGQDTVFSYSVNSSPRRSIRRSIKELVPLPRGRHEISVFRDSALYEKISFSIQ